MMKRMTRKLKSRSGATIVMAMAIFVLVSILSVDMVMVPLSAAASGYRRRNDEQATLLLTSAAGLIRESVVNQYVMIERKWTAASSGDASESSEGEGGDESTEESGSESISYGEPPTTTITVSSTAKINQPVGVFLKVFQEMALDRLIAIEKPQEEKPTCILTVTGTGPEINSPVTVTLTLEDNYDVTAVLTVPYKGTDYSLTQRFGATPSNTPYDNPVSYVEESDNVYYQYAPAVIEIEDSEDGEESGGGTSEEEATSVTVPDYYQYHVLKVTWPADQYEVKV